MSTRWFLTKIGTRSIGSYQAKGLILELVRKPDGSPFWPDNTRMRFAYADDSQGWALAIVDVSQAGLATVPVPEDPDVLAMPDVGLDVRLQSIAAGPAAEFRIFMDTLGITYTWGIADAYRALVRRLGRIGDPAFDEDAFGTF